MQIGETHNITVQPDFVVETQDGTLVDDEDIWRVLAHFQQVSTFFIFPSVLTNRDKNAGKIERAVQVSFVCSGM